MVCFVRSGTAKIDEKAIYEDCKVEATQLLRQIWFELISHRVLLADKVSRNSEGVICFSH